MNPWRTAPVIYERGGLRIFGPTADRPVAAVVLDAGGLAISLVETFDADQIDGLAAAVLRARELLRAGPDR